MTDFNAPLAYRASSLETAACLWEAVMDLEQIGRSASGDPAQELRGAQIRECREMMGSSSLRLTVIGWTDALEAAWRIADEDPATGHGGQYGAPFDWEFVPEWIVENIDWSNPERPQIK